MMAVKIPLTCGAFALVDDEDAERVLAIKWQLWGRGDRHRYACTHIRGENGKRRNIGMHRFIMGDPPGLSVDHVNGDGLDNRRENLRVVTRGQNRANSIKRANAGSLLKGVYVCAGKWRAQIASDKLPTQPWYIGTFSTPVDAAMAYDACARILFGEFARVNFPRGTERSALVIPEKSTEAA